MQDAVNNKKFVQVLAPLARTADANGEIDRQGYEALTILVDMGAEGITLSGTDKIEVVIEHSNTAGSGHVAVGADDIVLPDNKSAQQQAPDSNGTVAIFDANAEIPALAAFGYVGSKRHVKVTLNYSGTHGAGTPNAVTAILEHPIYAPAA